MNTATENPIPVCSRERGHDGPCNGWPCAERIDDMEKRERVTLALLQGMLASGQRGMPSHMVAAAVEYADELLRVVGA